jgi:predicted phage terminase large subunit-like protein
MPSFAKGSKTAIEKFRPATRKEIEQEFARRHLLDFITYTMPTYKVNWHHRVICDEIEDLMAGKFSRLILCTPPRMGKALEINTPIPTPEGWARIADLKVGDFVFDEHGQPVEVIAKSPVWPNRPVYRVKTDDDDEIIADAAHEWVVRLDRKHKVFRKYETVFLAKRTRSRAPMVKIQGPLALPDADLPIDPYVLGVWLGNGSSDTANFCIAIQDREVTNKVSASEGNGTFYTRRNSCEHFRPGPDGRTVEGRGNNLSARLRRLGLLYDKHIPALYLRASADQRLALLQGLIDTDGYVPDNGCIEFCSTCRQLAEDTHELVRSLGRKAFLKIGRAMLNGKDYGPKYRVRFYMKNAASLDRKAKNTREAKRFINRYITFEPAGYADTVCIEVDSPTHMFLCGRSMIPTCNSQIVSRHLPAYLLGRNPDARIIACSYSAELASAMNRDVQRIIDDARYHELFPNTKLSSANVRTVAGNYLRNSDVFEIVGRKGMYLSSGVGGGITGRGFNCVSGGALISTPGGDVPIETLRPGDSVLSFNHLNETLEFQKVEAVLSRETVEIYRIDTDAGRSLEVTGDHRIFTDGEYKAANNLTGGSALLCVLREGNEKDLEDDRVAQIVRIREKARVYDIQVSENHNFFANGILVHNCVGIIDDPVKNREEANSPTYRERIWDWYRSTFYTRREKGAKILLILTRWNEDDLAGRLLELQKNDPRADQWRVICFPAVFEGRDEYTHPDDNREIGGALWPSEYSIEDLGRIKASLGSYEWASLYQQRPTPQGGGIFMTTWWGFYDEASLPGRFDEIIQSWDMTFKDAATSDFVVGQVWGRAEERYYLLDQIRDRLDFPGTIRAVINLSRKWPDAKLKLVEDKANGPAVIAMLKRELSGLVAVEPQGSKEARAYAVSALVEAGNVFLPARAAWLDDFITEAASFPNGRNDKTLSFKNSVNCWKPLRAA